MCMKSCMCACTRLLSVHEAITLIILSLTVPEKLPNKPTVLGINEMSLIDQIENEFDHSLTFSMLESTLFKVIILFFFIKLCNIYFNNFLAIY